MKKSCTKTNILINMSMLPFATGSRKAFPRDFLVPCHATFLFWQGQLLQFLEGNELQDDDAYNDVGDHFFGRKQVFPCTMDLDMQFSALNMPNELV